MQFSSNFKVRKMYLQILNYVKYSAWLKMTIGCTKLYVWVDDAWLQRWNCEVVEYARRYGCQSVGSKVA